MSMAVIMVSSRLFFMLLAATTLEVLGDCITTVSTNASSPLTATLRCTRAALPQPRIGLFGLRLDGNPVPRTTPAPAPRTTRKPRPTPAPGEPSYLVEYLMNNLLAATAAPDTIWAATVEKQRCFPQPGAPLPVPALLGRLARTELSLCDPALLWDASMPAGEETLHGILAALSRPYVLARTPNSTAAAWLQQPANPPYGRRNPGHWQDVLPASVRCRGIVAVVDDVMSVGELLGNLSDPRVVVLTRSPKWRIRDFLASASARNIRNLLVVHDRAWRHGSAMTGFPDMDLYTHHLFYDSLGSSVSKVLTSWRCDRLTRPDTNLFPMKMSTGFAGHQFTVSASDTPPFMYRSVLNTDGDLSWDGIEIRLLRLLSERLNFTINIREASSDDSISGGSAVRVVETVMSGAAELGAGGIYVTQPRIEVVDMAYSHTQDCAAFLSLASSALPRYRAIMGPFQWTVWLALTLTYMFAILPLVYSHFFSLRILLKHPGQIENMFWYVFGTFTNSFSFKGRDSWTSTSRTSTRMIIGWYWVFSIIVTACYTGCIISFIAFPVFPTVVDHIWQLLDGNYQVGTLHSDGWSTWFLNSSDPDTDKLLEDLETVPTVWEGLKNMTHAYFWHPYAFLGSRLYLEHVVRTNYTAESKRSMVHVTKDCFVPFAVSIIFPKAASYSERFNHLLMRASQAGITEKLRRDVAWDVQRSLPKKKGRALLQVSTGALRMPPPEDRTLTLDDTQGMFLLLGAGFAIGAFALFVENCTGRVRCCRQHCQPGPRRRSSVASVPSALRAPSTPGSQLGSQLWEGAVGGDATPRAASRAGSRSTWHSAGSGIRKRTKAEVSVVEGESRPMSASQDEFLAVDVHSNEPKSMSSVFNKLVSTVTAAIAFQRAPQHKDGCHNLQVTEDQILHLSNAWSDRSGTSRVPSACRSTSPTPGSSGDAPDSPRGGRCRLGSLYPRRKSSSVQPLSSEERRRSSAGVGGPDFVVVPSSASSVFGSPVRRGSQVGDSSTYILFSEEDLRQGGEVGGEGSAPFRRSSDQLLPRPVAPKGHRRRSSVAVGLVDEQRATVDFSTGFSMATPLATTMHEEYDCLRLETPKEPVGSFPDSPATRPGSPASLPTPTPLSPPLSPSSSTPSLPPSTPPSPTATY